MFWQNCMAETFYGDGRLSETAECQVRLQDGRVEVCYAGSEVGSGHYRIRSTGKVIAEGSLHHFPDGRILDGWWKEDGAVGMWRITLRP